MNHNSTSEIQELLNRHGIALKKRFGQNFLLDARIRDRIGKLVYSAYPGRSVGSGEIWEIGPGLGALTDELIALNLPLRLFEIDHGIIGILRSRYGAEITIEGGDFLSTFPGVPSPALIVGNLPYHSAGTMVPRIVEEGLPVPAMVFLLQADMVDRLVSDPGTKSYSALTVLVRTHYTVERSFSVPASAFYPRPRVASAVAVLRELPNRPDRTLTAALTKLTRAAFGQRRKTLRNSLGDYRRAMEICGIDPALRPERLAPDDFLSLARVVLRLPESSAAGTGPADGTD